MSCDWGLMTLAKYDGRQRGARLIWLDLAATTLVGIVVAGCVLNELRPSASVQPTPCPSPQATSAPATQAVDPYRQFIYGGLPKTSLQLTLLKNKGYLVGYSEKHKDPAWVAYRLFKVENPQTHPRPSRFITDSRTQAKVKHDDYTGSGYDRGHMAPNYAIDVYHGKDGQRETFLMSNICPQKPKLNRRVWEHLERTEIRDYAVRFEDIWVIDGPIFDDQPEKLPAGGDVPSQFFNIIVDEENGRPRMLAFIIPQGVEGDEQLRMFLVSVDAIEKLTGLDFFTDLPKEEERKLEAAVPKEIW